MFLNFVLEPNPFPYAGEDLTYLFPNDVSAITPTIVDGVLFCAVLSNKRLDEGGSDSSRGQENIR